MEKEHELKETLTVDVYYPDHEPRKASNTFHHSRKQLIDVEDRACVICGSKERREAHHHPIEWAFAQAVDWEKVKADFPDFDWANFDQEKPETFIDSCSNLIVYCRLHHIGKDHGIHMLPYPIFIFQKYKKEEFVFSPDEVHKTLMGFHHEETEADEDSLD